MNKTLRSLFALALLAALLASSLGPAGSASASPQAEGDAPTVTPRVFIPVMFAPPENYTITGQVLDEAGAPQAGVTVTGSGGETTTTDGSGAYSLVVQEGDNSLLVAKPDVMFSPSVVDLDVSGDLSAQNFLACTQVFGNNSFENLPPAHWWNLPDYGTVDYPIFPATPVSNWQYEEGYGWVWYPVHSGTRSLRTGIPFHRVDLVQRSWSDAISQGFYITPGSASAWLTLWIYPVTTEPVAKPLPAQPAGEDFYNTPMAADAQYIRVLDAYTNEQLEIIRWKKENTGAWTYIAYDLVRWAGRSIKINIGTYNDGVDGMTTMYVDDVFFHICPPAPPPPPPPPPPSCTQRIYNGSFEYNSDWYIPATMYSAGYSYAFWRSGWRSMRTGIYYLSHNTYSYSDFAQTVYIPWNAVSAVLRFYAYEMTGEPPSLAIDAPPSALEGGQLMLNPTSGDVQYLLVLDQWQNWVGTLHWQRVHQPWWGYYEYDLWAYRGQTIRLQWGTYNNGYSGVTSMYVDDVTLLTCQ